MKKTNKIWISLGLMSVTAFPIATMVSCGAKKENDKVENETPVTDVAIVANEINKIASSYTTTEDLSSIVSAETFTTNKAKITSAMNVTFLNTVTVTYKWLSSEEQEINFEIEISKGTIKQTKTIKIIGTISNQTVVDQAIDMLQANYTTNADLSSVTNSGSYTGTAKTAIETAINAPVISGVNWSYAFASANSQAITITVTATKGSASKNKTVIVTGGSAETITTVSLDFTTKVSGVISAKEIYKHFLNKNYALTTNKYIFKLKAHASESITPLDFELLKSDLEDVRNAVHTATPIYPSAEMSLSDFVDLMKDATGSSFSTKPQFSISTEDGKKLGLTTSGAIDVAHAKTFFTNKFIGTFPNGINYADEAKNKPFNPNILTNNMEVTFKNAVGTENKAQFNMKVEKRLSNETDAAYEARLDQINSNSAKGTKFTVAIDAGVQELKDYSAKLVKFLDKIKSAADNKLVAKYIIGSFTKFIVDEFTQIIPIYGQIAALPIVGGVLNRKINDYLLGNYIDKMADFVVEKIYPTQP